MKNKMKFGVFTVHSVIIAELRKAWSIDELLKILPQKTLKFWTHIQYKDSENRMIQITREYIDEQGMTVQECIDDWIEHMSSEFDESIMCMNGSDYRNPIYL
jgi:hypothetical protein